MSIVEANWQGFLSPDSDLPPDVIFLVKSEEGGSERKTNIGGHQFLLAGISPVIRKMFFGPMNETGGVVEVEGTTSEAFSTMITCIYLQASWWRHIQPK